MTLLATFINAETQDYVAQDGILIQRNALLTEGYTRSNTPLRSYQFDPLFGNELILKLNTRLNTRVKLTSAQITIMQNNALQPMKDQGRALAIYTQVSSITNNMIFLESFITDTDGVVYRLPLNFMRGGLNAA